MSHPYITHLAARNGDLELGHMLSNAQLAAQQGSGFFANSGAGAAYIHDGTAIAMAGPGGAAVAVAPPKYVEVHKKRRICCGMTACCLAISVTVGLLIVASVVAGVVIHHNRQNSSLYTD